MGLENLKEKYNNDKKEVGEIQSPIVGNKEAYDYYKNNNALSNLMSNIAAFNNTSKAYDKDLYDSYVKYGVYLNNNDTQEELDKKRAKAQSVGEKWLRSFGQIIGNELLLGSLKSFGDIWDAIANINNEYNDYSSAYTDFFQKAQDNLREKWEIYRQNPGKSFDVGDWGWWADNFVTVGSTLSLMIPSVGTTLAIGKIGKALTLDNKINRLLTGAAKFAKVRHPNFVAKTAQNWGKAAFTATLSRIAESYQEAQQNYKQIYEDSLNTLNNYTEDDYNRLKELHPEYNGLSNEEIAKRLASKGANQTFKEDMALLALDAIRYYGLGQMLNGKYLTRWGKIKNQIAERNSKLALAAKVTGTEATLESEGFFHVAKLLGKNALTNPVEVIKSLPKAFELSEGFEEGFQGIMSERGQEVAKMILQKGYNQRTLESYLKDGEIWEQAFWGALGGVVFGAAGKGVSSIKNKIENKINNKDVVDESKRKYSSYDEMTNASINNRLNKMQQIVEQLTQIDVDNVLPEGYDNRYETDENGKVVLDEAGKPVLRKITESEREQVKGDIIKDFITDFTIDALDAGTLDGAIDFMQDPNFVEYFKKNGVTDNQLIAFTGERIKDYIEKVRNEYEEFTGKVLNSKYNLNPYTTLAYSRSLTRKSMQIYNMRERVKVIGAELANTQEYKNLKDPEAVEDYIKLRMINDNIDSIEREEFVLDMMYENGQFSKVAYDNYRKELRDKKLAYINSLNETTDRIDFKHSISKLMKEVNDRFQKDNDTDVYNDSVNNILRALKQNINSYIANENTIENEHISEDLSKKIYAKAVDEFDANYLETLMPKTKEEYVKEADELYDAMSKTAKDRKEKALNRVSKYLSKSDDINKAWNAIMENKTGDKQLEKDLQLLNLGHKNTYEYFVQLKALKDDIEERKNKEANTANVAGKEVTGEKAKETNNELEEARNEAENNKPKEETTTNDNEVQSTNTSSKEINEFSPVKEEELSNDEVEYIDSGQGDDFTAEQEPNIDEATEKYIAEQEQALAEEEARHSQQARETYIPDDPFVSTEDIIQGVLMTQLMTPEAKQLFAKISHVSDAAFNELYNMMKRVAENENMGELSSKQVDKIIFDILKSIVTFYTKRNSNSRLENLLSELKLGGTFKNNGQDVVYTVFGNKAEINSVVEKVLDEYASQSNIYYKGKKVIKLDLLFDYIINNNDISYGEARAIFEHIKNYFDNNKIDKYIIDSAYFNKGKYTVDELIKTLDLKRKQIGVISKYMHINKSNNTDATEINRVLQLHKNNRTKYPIIIKRTENAISFTIDNVEIGYLSEAMAYTNANNNGYIQQMNTFGLFNAVRKETNGTISSVFDRWLSPLAELNEAVTSVIEYLKRNNTKEEDINIDDIINDFANNYAKDVIEFYKLLAEANQYRSVYGAKSLLKKIQNNEIFKNFIETNGLKVTVGGKLEPADANAYRLFRIKDSSKAYVDGNYDIDYLTDKDYDSVTANLIVRFNDIVFNQYSYEKWKDNIYTNLSKTIEIQNELNKVRKNEEVVADLIMDGVEVVNSGETQIKDLSSDNNGHMDAKRNPLVFIEDKDGRGIIEGKSSYTNPSGFKQGTVGILSHTANGYPIIAPIKKMNKIYDSKNKENNSAFGIAVRNELLGAIDDWRAGKISLSELSEIINNIGYSRTSPFGYGIVTKVNGAGTILNIYRFPTNKEKSNGQTNVVPLATLYNEDKNKNNVTSIIIKGINKNGSSVAFYKAELDEKYKTNAKYIKNPTEVLADYLLNHITFSKTFYPITHAAEKYERSNPYFQKEESKYRVHFPKRESIGSEFNESYDSFTDFYMKINAAVVGTKWDEKTDSYTQLGARWSGNGLYVTTSIQKKVNYTESDLSETGVDKDSLKKVFDNFKNGQLIRVIDILSKMNVDNSVLDVIYKTKGLIAKQIRFTTGNYLDAKMVTNSKNEILLTANGVKNILESVDPLSNFTRMIFHESLHKRLHETKANNFSEEQQKDLFDTYQQFITAIKTKNFKIKINEEEYKKLLGTVNELERIYGNILSKEAKTEEQKQKNYNKFLEEWLVDSMTIGNVLQAMSIIEYKGTIEATKSKSRIQTILDKIIEIISKIFGLNIDNTLKNSILEKQKSIFNRQRKKNTETKEDIKEDIKDDTKKDAKKKTIKKTKEVVTEPTLFDYNEYDKVIQSEEINNEVKESEEKINKETNISTQEETSFKQEDITKDNKQEEEASTKREVADDEVTEHTDEELAADLADDDSNDDDVYTEYGGENFKLTIPAKEEAINTYNEDRKLNPNGFSPIKNIDDFLKQYPSEMQPILDRMVKNGLIEYICG